MNCIFFSKCRSHQDDTEFFSGDRSYLDSHSKNATNIYKRKSLLINDGELEVKTYGVARDIVLEEDETIQRENTRREEKPKKKRFFKRIAISSDTVSFVLLAISRFIPFPVLQHPKPPNFT